MQPFPGIVIRASAGTGKTYQLSNRYLGLLNAGASVDEILATTFTRKAAGEILDRVLQRLAEAATDSKAASRLAIHLNDPAINTQRCSELLAQVTCNLHRLRISTLDSLFTKLAGSHALELGLPLGWSIIDDLADTRLRNQAIELLLRDDAANDISRLLHLMTQGDVDRSVSRLLNDAVRDLYSLFLETDATAWQRFPSPRLLTGDDFESSCRALEQESMEGDSRMIKARDGDLESLRNGDWATFVSKGLSSKIISGERTYYRKLIPDTAIALYERLTSHVRGVLLNQLAQQTHATYELLSRFHLLYERLKTSRGAMRFEDVTRRLAAGMEKSTTSIATYDFRMDASAAHILLDEFQDTSLAQWQALRPFAERATASGPWRRARQTATRRSFFCVGDEKQAIYGWRGGKSEIFAALEQNLTGLEKENLDESFRSAPAVIDTINQIFKQIPRHNHLERFQEAVASWCQAVPTHTTAHTDLPGYAVLETGPLPDEGGSAADATLAFAADRIAQIVRLCPTRSVGVLARKNDVVAQLIYELRKRDVPASEEGGNPLTDSVAVQALMSLLRLADHPGDNIARFHLVHSPLATVIGLTQDDDTQRVALISADLRRQLLEQGYGPAIENWVRQLRPELSVRDSGRLDQLIDLAYAYERNATLRPLDFARLVESKRIADPSVAAVRVMTVHQAKGLQFDVVVLADLDNPAVGQPPAYVVRQADPTKPIERVCLYRNSDIQQLLPADIQAMFVDETRQQISESLCVLYVAITRPVHALHLIVAPTRGKQNALPRSYAGFLRAALTDGGPASPQQILFQTGDPQWFKSVPEESPPLVTPRHRPTISLREMTGGRRSGWDRRSPSSLEVGEVLRIEDVLATDNRQAQLRGTLMHAWFETIGWLEEGLPEDEKLRAIAESSNTRDLSITRFLAEFRRMLQLPEVSKLLTRAGYLADAVTWCHSRTIELPPTCSLQLEKEFPFALRHEGRLMSGAIDRLIVGQQAGQNAFAEIVDFKTDFVSANDPSAFEGTVSRYRPQQLAYRAAVAEFCRLPPRHVRTRLVFVGAGVVVEVE